MAEYLKTVFLVFFLIWRPVLGLSVAKFFSSGMVLQEAPITANVFGFNDNLDTSVSITISCENIQEEIVIAEKVEGLERLQKKKVQTLANVQTAEGGSEISVTVLYLYTVSP